MKSYLLKMKNARINEETAHKTSTRGLCNCKEPETACSVRSTRKKERLKLESQIKSIGIAKVVCQFRIY